MTVFRDQKEDIKETNENLENKYNVNITESINPISIGKEEEALSFILTNSFRSGFGTLSKTELDLILFATLLKFSDKKNNSDLALSKYLQITQQRVRNMKEKASVKYLAIDRAQAITIFLNKVENSKIEDKYIDIPINNVAVKNEIEGLLDENNILLHTQLNPKIFRIRIDDFLELTILIEIETNPDRRKKQVEKSILKNIKKKVKEEEKFMNGLGLDENSLKELTKKSLKEGLLKGGLAFGVDLLASCIPGGAFMSQPVKNLLSSLSSKL